MSQVLVLGAGLTAFGGRKLGKGFRDLAEQAFVAALEMADVDISDIDALIVASESDFFSLQLNPAALLASELGLVGVATQRMEGGGASGQLAVHAAYGLIAGGSAQCVAVVGFDCVASSLPARTVRMLYGYSFDGIISAPTGVTASALYALSFQDFAARSGATAHHLDAVTISNRSNAIANPGAHLPRQHSAEEIAASAMVSFPYRRLHCSPLSDGAAAVILATSEKCPTSRRSASRISGIGGASDRAHLGARKMPGIFSAKRKAMQRACTMADLRPDRISVAEVYDAYAGAQLQAIDALGLSGDWLKDLADGIFDRQGHLPINLSGGLMGQGAPVGATGVAQTATCAMLLEGRYHAALQPPRALAHAVADTHGGICTNSAVTLLSAA